MGIWDNGIWQGNYSGIKKPTGSTVGDVAKAGVTAGVAGANKPKNSASMDATAAASRALRTPVQKLLDPVPTQEYEESDKEQ